VSVETKKVWSKRVILKLINGQWEGKFDSADLMDPFSPRDLLRVLRLAKVLYRQYRAKLVQESKLRKEQKDAEAK